MAPAFAWVATSKDAQASAGHIDTAPCGKQVSVLHRGASIGRWLPPAPPGAMTLRSGFMVIPMPPPTAAKPLHRGHWGEALPPPPPPRAAFSGRWARGTHLGESPPSATSSAVPLSVPHRPPD